VARCVDGIVASFARHWLAVLNIVLLVWLGLAALAPVLATAGHGVLASAVYALHRPLCHQRPERSFHLLGEKMACCERCFAIYGGAALFGLAFFTLRGLRPLAWSRFVLCCLPMAVDGVTQLLGLRESNSALRVVSGGLFAVSTTSTTAPAWVKRLARSAAL
jgi:uncharacterized membrane protein